MNRVYHGHALDEESRALRYTIMAIQGLVAVTSMTFFGLVVAAWLLGY
jgi:hypothetical protein